MPTQSAVAAESQSSRATMGRLSRRFFDALDLAGMEGAIGGVGDGESLEGVGVGRPHPALVLSPDGLEKLLYLAEVAGLLPFRGDRLAVDDAGELEVIGEAQVEVGADDLEGKAIGDAGGVGAADIARGPAGELKVAG